MTLDELKENKGKHFTVRGYKGVAFYFRGAETYIHEEGEELEDGRAIMVMVGDDYKHKIDPEDVSLIPEDSFCRDCGQIGCTSNVYE